MRLRDVWTRVAVTRHDNYCFQLFNYTAQGNAAGLIQEIIKRHFFLRFLPFFRFLPFQLFEIIRGLTPNPHPLFIRLSGRDQHCVCCLLMLLLLLLRTIIPRFFANVLRISRFPTTNFGLNNFENARTKMKIVSISKYTSRWTSRLSYASFLWPGEK